MSRSLTQSILAGLLLTALIFASTAGFLAKVLDYGRIGTGFLMTPFVAVFSRINSFLSIIFNLRQLAAQNGILTKQVEELTSQVAVLEKEQQENRLLRDALGFAQDSELEFVPAEIISLDPFRGDVRVTLNRGAKQGIQVQDAVIISGNIMVGVVAEVSENTSQMDLITSSQVTVNAESAGGAATGLVRGEHGLGLLFDLVAQNEVLAPGDKIITSGLSGLFPENLLIGTLGEVRSSSSELFQRAAIIPAANLRNLRFVFVVKN